MYKCMLMHCHLSVSVCIRAWLWRFVARAATQRSKKISISILIIWPLENVSSTLLYSTALFFEENQSIFNSLSSCCFLYALLINSKEGKLAASWSCLGMSLTQFASPDLVITVRGGFLTLAVFGKGIIATLNCNEISRFAKSLCSNLKQPNFEVKLQGTALLCRDKIVYTADSKRVEQLISSEDFQNLIRALVDCSPYMLLNGVGTLPFVVCVHLLVVFLTEKASLEEGETCIKNLKVGRSDKVLSKFMELVDFAEDKNKLLEFFVFNSKIIYCSFKLRCLLLVKKS